jgi:hypothetical protein
MDNCQFGPKAGDEETVMRLWFSARLSIWGLLLGGANSSALAMPFVAPQPPTLAEELAAAHFVVVGMLYGGEPGTSEGGGTTEAALLNITKDHPGVKDRKHLTIQRYVPTKRPRRYFVLFGEVDGGKVDVYRGIPCSGAKDELVRYLKCILDQEKPGQSEGLSFYQRHLEHRNPEIAEDAFRAFRKATFAELQRHSRFCDAKKLQSWVADKKVPEHRKQLYRVLLIFCEGTRKDCGEPEPHAAPVRAACGGDGGARFGPRP